jgi:hypothetical protein
LILNNVFLMFTLLIQGKNLVASNNFDVYLQHVVEEL